MSEAEPPPFVRIGPARPVSPIVLSVPHAGRAYRPELLAAARLDRSKLEALEDRLVDRLVWRATNAGATAIVARAPRAEIDLNRDEREIDPLMVHPPLPSVSVVQTVRSRAGIGLVPSRIAGAGSIWIDRLPRAELARRIESIHRPYHAALERALREARALFGAAILVDCHSMPARTDGQAEPLVVFGDRHGTSCSPDLLDAAVAAAAALGYRTACNAPYAGGYIVRRHGQPAGNVHALQVEIDRSAYLDAAMRSPGAGFDAACTLFASLAGALEARLIGPELGIAAE